MKTIIPCPYCGSAQISAHYNNFRNHFFLCLLTFGLWIPFAIILIKVFPVKAGDEVSCNACGFHFLAEFTPLLK